MTSSCNSRIAAKNIYKLQCSYLRKKLSDRRHFNADCTISITILHLDRTIRKRIDDVIMQYQDGRQRTFTVLISQKPMLRSTSFQRLLCYIDYNLSFGSHNKEKNWWRHHAIPRWPSKNTSGDLSKTPEISVRSQETPVGPQETSLRPQETSLGPQETSVRPQETSIRPLPGDLSKILARHSKTSEDLSKTPGDQETSGDPKKTSGDLSKTSVRPQDTSVRLQETSGDLSKT